MFLWFLILIIIFNNWILVPSSQIPKVWPVFLKLVFFYIIYLWLALLNIRYLLKKNCVSTQSKCKFILKNSQDSFFLLKNLSKVFISKLQQIYLLVLNTNIARLLELYRWPGKGRFALPIVNHQKLVQTSAKPFIFFFAFFESLGKFRNCQEAILKYFLSYFCP